MPLRSAASRAALKERLLGAMDRKHHPSWARFEAGELSTAQLLRHYEQEWWVITRDYPVLLARVLGMAPPEAVRAYLAAEIYEEQTGGLSGTAPHADLFLGLMARLGADEAAFDRAPLLGASRRLLDGFDALTAGVPWQVAFAATALFIDGTAGDRALLAQPADRIPAEAELDRWLSRHPLVRHHGLPVGAMVAARAHMRAAIGDRHRAWAALLDHTPSELDDAVVAGVEEILARWLDYRAAVGALWEAP